MAYRVILTPRAVSDAESAVEYISRSSPQSAARWFEGLTTAILSLSDLPDRCALSPEAARLQVEIRELAYGKRKQAYRIVFRIYESARRGEGVVRVLTIRHTARERIRDDDIL